VPVVATILWTYDSGVLFETASGSTTLSISANDNVGSRIYNPLFLDADGTFVVKLNATGYDQSIDTAYSYNVAKAEGGLGEA